MYIIYISYEAALVQGFLKKTEKKLAWLFNITFRYMCDVLSLKISKFGEYVGICSNELDINDTTDTASSSSCLSLHI